MSGEPPVEIVEGTATVEDVDAFVERVQTIGDAHDATVQAFDARYVVGREHLERALAVARRERERGDAIARDPAVEILLYAAGRRQIQRAMQMGVTAGVCPVVAVAAGGEAESAADALGDLLDPAETLGAYDEGRVREFFDISDREREATAGDIADIVHERVAMLVVER